jgi:signal transduction histidine kinase
VPIRWRLAGGSALLTLVILCAFAVTVGALTSEQLREDFDEDVAGGAKDLAERIDYERYDLVTDELYGFHPSLTIYVAGKDAAARVVLPSRRVARQSRGAPDLGPLSRSMVRINGLQVATVRRSDGLFVQYAEPVASVEATVRLVRLFLVGGVIGGAGLALLAGLMIARRAMEPITELTETAREIQQTRDPSRRMPVDGADDEVAELARTLDGMLVALDESRTEQEAMLRRQREFVADASHELRTPLTSVLANLELLAETLDGDQGDAAESALRSSRRMRRLVQDLLLLARADARRSAPHEPLDLGQVLVEAAAELEPVAEGHDLGLEPRHEVVDGARDELHRLALNLMENAVRHTPEGTRIRAGVTRRGGRVVLTVEDDGPGIPPELRDRVFERFVRGSGDRGGSSGLGLSIVRAVAESHGGRVELGSPSGGRGTRFVVTLPAAEPDGARALGTTGPAGATAGA